jgi:hypothetical protein
MSYGFLCRQPAFALEQVLLDDEAMTLPDWQDWRDEGIGIVNGQQYAALRIGSRWVTMKVPDVTVLATRSGCDKSHIDGYRDLVELSMRGGVIMMRTPKGLDAKVDARPSYDTLTILAHATANVMIASAFERLSPGSDFVRIATQSGLALAHWHGELDQSVIPSGYVVFGEEHPPVSCSTRQAALFTLLGKLRAFSRQLEATGEYRGDVHIEPHHGINVTWPTLKGLAEAILASRSAKP